MNAFLSEFIGTALLLLLGNGVVAGVVLRGSKSENGGWIVITLGWGLAVTLAVYTAANFSGAHLNPAVSLGLAATGQWSEQFTPATLPLYLLAQMLGAMLGATLVYFQYLPHWALTESKEGKLAVFCTAPAVRHTGANFFSEFLGTFVLLFGICALGANRFSDGLNPIVVGALVVSIGLSLGGSTGYAINPARDLGPRIAHYLLPIPGKGDSDWSYSWIPVVAPILGGICGAVAYRALFISL
jgi:glycerol uptake facilitator protein